MNRKRILSKINIQIALYFLVIAIGLTAVLSVAAYYIAGNLIFDITVKQTKEAVSQSSDYISVYLDKIKSLSDLIAMHPQTKEAVRQENGEAVSALAGMVNLAAKSDERIQTIALISKNGFAITGSSDMAVPLSGDMMKEDWYISAVNSNQMPVINSIRHGDFTMDKSSWVISFSKEITGRDKEHLGVILIDVSYKFIEDYISKLDLGEKGYAYIINSKNEILYHPDESALMDKMKADELLALSKADQMTYRDNRFITKKEILHSDWLLIGVSSMENVNLLKKRLFQTLLLLDGMIVLCSIFISIKVSGRLTKPITELQNAMRNVDESWGHININSKSSTEIKDLAKEYNALLDRIRTLTEDIAEKENAKRIFELKALQSQINPHFLYNTLDTILWLAEFGENDKVVEVSKALGEMLRHSLNINQMMVPLEQELTHTENYLKIQQQRYVDKFDYTVEGEPQLLTVSVPKLMIQPIVENAIYHGIRSMKEKGHIRISYRQSGDDLIITISDNGIGLARSKENKERIKTKLGGIGLANVDQRIKILHGNQYGITISEEKTGGTKVVVRLRKL